MAASAQAGGFGSAGWGMAIGESADSDAAGEETVPLVLGAGAGAGAGAATAAAGAVGGLRAAVNDYATGTSRVHAAAVVPAAGEGATAERSTVVARPPRDTEDYGRLPEEKTEEPTT